jgi:putative ABC transport system ATP-binding protein
METQTEPTQKPAADSNGKAKVVPADKAIVALSGVRKSYFRNKEELVILDGIDLNIEEGAFEALMGPSGSGKTTLLNLIAGLDRPTAGKVMVAGTDISGLSESQLADWRAKSIGFVFQFYNLIPVLTAAQNVELPLLLRKMSGSDRRQRVQTALRVVGLEDRMDHFPRQLSGGQEQRVAIARAIVSDPQIIVGDEPTGDLDRKAADDVLTIFTKLNRELKKTIVMVTHDPAAAERASIIRRLNKGQLE